MTTSELDNLAAETAAYMNIDHPDYAKLAARVSVSNLHKASCSRGTHRQTDRARSLPGAVCALAC